jgi:hypothetical protein
MGRPLKIQKLNNSIPTDVGFNNFSSLDSGTAVIPVGMTSSQFLGVVGGANTGIATSTYPVVAITANINGQQGSAYIITQKGQTKYLVSGEDSVTAGSFTVGFSYQILTLGNTNWTAIGAGVNPQVGGIFTATGVGAGNGTASDCGQAVLIADISANLVAGQMNMAFNTNGNTVYASRLTNKYIWDSSNTRYAVNFFVSGETTPVVLANVAIANTSGGFTSNAANIVVNQVVSISGTLTGSGTIVGYANPKNYFVTSTNSANAFVLSTTLGGANIVTTAGNTRGLTFTQATSTTVKSGADPVTWTNATGNLTLAQVASYTS